MTYDKQGNSKNGVNKKSLINYTKLLRFCVALFRTNKGKKKKETDLQSLISSCRFASPRALNKSNLIRVSAERLFSRCVFFSCILSNADLSISVSRTLSNKIEFSRSSVAILSSAQRSADLHSCNSVSSSLLRALHDSVHSPLLVWAAT